MLKAHVNNIINLTLIMSLKIEIIDDFLSKDDLKILQSLKLKETKEKEMNVYVKKIDSGNNISGSGINDETAKEFQKNYHSKALELLKKLYPEKVELYDYSEFGINDTGNNYNFPIHNDTPNKLLSGVIFLSPHKSTGTKFYENKKGKGEKEIDWKINRAVFFSREENRSWHSFNHSGEGVRRVLIYNLMTTNTKAVCKIEKVNYFFVHFKFLINPYLYKYFKFVI